MSFEKRLYTLHSQKTIEIYINVEAIMRVILKKDVPNLGRAGELKDVKNGYARNYLIPQGFVMLADARTQKQKAFIESMQRQKVAKRKKTAEETSAQLNGKEIHVVVNVGEQGKLFGSIGNLQVQKAIEAEGFFIDRKTIEIPEPFKTLGIYDVNIKLYEGVQCSVKVFVEDPNGNTKIDVTEDEVVITEESLEDDDSSESTEESND